MCRLEKIHHKCLLVHKIFGFSKITEVVLFVVIPPLQKEWFKSVNKSHRLNMTLMMSRCMCILILSKSHLHTVAKTQTQPMKSWRSLRDQLALPHRASCSRLHISSQSLQNKLASSARCMPKPIIWLSGFHPQSENPGLGCVYKSIALFFTQTTL